MAEGEIERTHRMPRGRPFIYAPFLIDPGRSGSIDYAKEPLSVSSRRAAFVSADIPA